MESKHILITFLKNKRKELGLTREAFASYLDIPFNTYKSYEIGKSGIKSEVIDHICKKLKIEPWRLFAPPEIKDPESEKLASDLNIIKQAVNKIESKVNETNDKKKLTEYYAPSLERNLTYKEFKHVLYLDSLVYSFKTSKEFIKTLSPEDNELWRASINAINDRFGYYRYTALREHLKKHDPQFREGPPWWHDIKTAIDQEEADEAKRLA